MPSPKKLPTIRQGHRTRDLALRDEAPPVPIPPRRLTKRSRQRWAMLWQSPIAKAWDPIVDIHIVERWIRAIDEYEKVQPVFEKTRLVKGSTGQIALNPLAAYLAQREAVIKVCETELGIGPSSRLKLGITIGEAKLTAERLNRELSQRPEDPDPDLIEGEWEEV